MLIAAILLGTLLFTLLEPQFTIRIGERAWLNVLSDPHTAGYNWDTREGMFKVVGWDSEYEWDCMELWFWLGPYFIRITKRK